MVKFKTVIKRFNEQAEKTGWTYIQIPAEVALQLVPNNKKSFRVKGFLDDHAFEGISLAPVGGGDFILPLNAEKRKAIKKQKGAEVIVQLAVDTKPILPPDELMDCLKDEPDALKQFDTIAPSHRTYFINWINSAKTVETKATRIAATVNALARKWDYGIMIRSLKKDRADLKAKPD